MLNLTTTWLRSLGLLPTPLTREQEIMLAVRRAGVKMIMIHMLEATPHRRLG